MAAPKVFIFAPADPTEETHRRLEMAGCQLVLGKAGWHTPKGDNEDEMAAMARDAVALMGTSIRSSPITRRIMASSDQLRIVAKYTIGVDDVDVDAATELGILVTHGPTESNWGGVAEGTMAMMLALLKRVRERDEHMKRGGWRLDELQGVYLGARQDGYPGITIGIVGLGRIGARLALLLQPWRVRLLAHDPYVPRDRFALVGARAVDLDTLLRESDVVTLHVTLTRETYHLIGAAELAKMKPTAVLINTSRGKVVDEAALAEALERGVIQAAALDVFEDEPLAQDSPLLRLGHKVLLSPHMVSSNLASGLGPGIEWATESVLRALRGEVPDNVFNKEVIPRWVERFGGRSVLPAP
ncbi:MAG TPA: NAD(P)-dependent oxidoreductase [Chloroflexota bacterium]|jgi:phosphoglycerate dehydrogenase-like enzyme|nr:NAD(P)-dependent oxidoreductase [Chloroflexota bacterium]